MEESPTAEGRDSTGADPDLPARIGPFRVLERLGAGGMGVVFLAERRTPIEQRVALKVIRTDRLDRTYRARFAMEQSALARMDHPNIARLLDAGENDGQSWFAMEFVPGEPLDDYCRDHRLSIGARLALFRQVCDGVQHAHVKGILHRDLKPGNIVVREIDGRPVAKIIDFGLAQPVDPLQIRATLHEAARQIVGTIAYMSPEQARRTEGDLDTRTDVYSLGVVLYELLIGQLPVDLAEVQHFGIARLAEFLWQHEPKKPSTRVSTMAEAAAAAAERCTSPARLRASLRGDLDWVTMKAMARDRQRRYQGVGDLARDIERFLRNQPVEAGPPSAAYVARKWVRRHAVGVALGGVLCGSALGLGAQAYLHANERTAREREALLDLRLLATPGLLSRADEISFGPDCRAEIAAWRAKAGPILAGLDEAGAAALPVGTERRAVFERFLREDRPRLVAASELLAELDALGGEVDEVMAVQAGAWETCIAELVADARYRVTSFEVQYGLAPLGRDPHSGWFEFACLATGAIPARDAETGRLQLDEESALVLVLLPGGEFTMGTPAGVVDELDEALVRDERPAHGVAVSPFFLGKTELTSLHVERLCADPSFWNLEAFGKMASAAQRSGIAVTAEGLRRGLPIGNLDWFAARTLLRHMGLRLPTESEWEYAARAGSVGPRSCGSAVAEVRRFANLTDVGSLAAALRPEETDPRWLQDSDRYPTIAPIAAFAASPWGFHDLYGNLAEWCEDSYRPYSGDQTSEQANLRVVRGGSFFRRSQDARSAARRTAPPGAAVRDVGVRTARGITCSRPAGR